MNDSILSTSGKVFQKFISHLIQRLTKPKAKFIRQLLCGVLLLTDIVLTNAASRVPQAVRLTAIAKRFRRQLADGKAYLKQLWSNCLSLVHRRLDIDGLFMAKPFIVDLIDLAKPCAKRMENLTVVRDGDTRRVCRKSARGYSVIAILFSNSGIFPSICQ
jgi:hypothetical protein